MQCNAPVVPFQTAANTGWSSSVSQPSGWAPAASAPNPMQASGDWSSGSNSVVSGPNGWAAPAPIPGIFEFSNLNIFFSFMGLDDYGML